MDASTGAFIWSYTTGSTVQSSPAVADGIVYVGSDDDRVYALSASSGALVWSYTTGSYVKSSPAVAGSTVYVGSDDGKVYAFGLPLSVSISPSSVLMDVGQSQLFTSSVTGGTSPYAYQWYLNGSPVSGATSPTWTFTPASAGSYTVYVKVTDDVGDQATSNTVAITVNDRPSVTISPTSVTLDVGQPQLFTSSVTGGTSPYAYQWYLNGSPVSGATSPTWTFTPASAGSYTVYVKVTDSVGVQATSNSATVTVGPEEYAKSWRMFRHDLTHTGYSTSTAPNTNQTLWSYTTGGFVLESSPAVAGGKVYVGSYDGKVYALNAITGAFIWSYTIGGYVQSSPAVADGKVYIGSQNGPVYALNADTGALVWSYPMGGGVVGSPAVVGGFVYVGSWDWKVYCLNAATGAFVWSYTTGAHSLVLLLLLLMVRSM